MATSYVCISRRAPGGVLEQRADACPVEVSDEADPRRIVVSVTRDRPEEVRVALPVGQQRVCVGV